MIGNQSSRRFFALFDYLLGFLFNFFSSHNTWFKPLEDKISVMDSQDNVKAQEREIVDELEHEVEDLEREFSQVESDENVSDSMKEKQEQVENILSEVHQQLDFLREVSEKMPDDNSEQDRKE